MSADVTRPIGIVKAGSTIPRIAASRGDFETWIQHGLGVGAADVEVVSPFLGEDLPAPEHFRAVVVSGSAAYVSDREEWSERTAAWLARVLNADVPILGICYGHQLLAHAVGGSVGRNPHGREMGTVEIDLNSAIRHRDALLGALPASADVHTTHLESVLELPPTAVRLASSALDENHAFALGRHAWGVQFHPEFDADVMRDYVRARASDLTEEGADSAAILSGVRETPSGGAVLRRFREIAAECGPVAHSPGSVKALDIRGSAKNAAKD